MSIHEVRLMAAELSMGRLTNDWVVESAVEESVSEESVVEESMAQ